jgi:hypothetical protein
VKALDERESLDDGLRASLVDAVRALAAALAAEPSGAQS